MFDINIYEEMEDENNNAINEENCKGKTLKPFSMCVYEYFNYCFSNFIHFHLSLYLSISLCMYIYIRIIIPLFNFIPSLSLFLSLSLSFSLSLFLSLQEKGTGKVH